MSRKRQGSHSSKPKRMSVAAMILLDVLAIGIGLVVFALFHHVLPTYFGFGVKKSEPVVLATLPPQPAVSLEPTAAPAQSEGTETEEAEPTPEPTPTRVYSGVWGEKFADKFTEGEVIQTENSYRSENVSVTVERVVEDRLVYYVADIYVSDLKYLGTAFANGEGNGDYRSGLAEIDAMAKRVNAIVAIYGDHYHGRQEGLIVRNGVLYQETPFQDVCVLYTDGRMETMTRDELDIEAVKAAGVWQAWSFGPGLLDAEGHAKTFGDHQANVMGINPQNPRSAIGYYEPGHYCLVEIEGNRAGCFIGSYGLTLSEMGTLFEQMGCKCAYNLDGGRSAAIAWMGERINVNYGRTLSDIIYVTDTPVESEG